MDVACSGMTVLDLDVERSPRDSLTEIADGLWTGMEVTQLVTAWVNGEERCFAFVKDADGNNAIREISAHQYGRDFSGPIRSRLYTRALDLAGILAQKTFAGLDVFLSKVVNSTKVRVAWKPDGHPVWRTLGHKAKEFGCRPACPSAPCNVVAAPAARQSFGTDEQNKAFYRAEVRLDIQGHARLNALRVQATPVSTEAAFGPSEPKDCGSVEACPDNDFLLGVLQ
jgi:hypothetical protein